MFKFSWDKAKPKYSFEETKKKPLPIYYDFYDLNKDFINVYCPSEDSFLLIDSVLNELDEINLEKNDLGINGIEIGCGNGLVSCCVLGKLKEIGIKINKYFCVDINKDAVELTKNLLRKYSLDDNVDVIESDLFHNIKENILFDFIIFNPPYVTTDNYEYLKSLEKKDICASWAGGKNGSETIYKFVDMVQNFIKPKGYLFLLLSKENEYQNIIYKLCNDYKFNIELLMKREILNEKLSVFKFIKN